MKEINRRKEVLVDNIASEVIDKTTEEKNVNQDSAPLSLYEETKEKLKEAIRVRKFKKYIKSRFKNKKIQESLKAMRNEWESNDCQDIKSVSYQHLRISNF